MIIKTVAIMFIFILKRLYFFIIIIISFKSDFTKSFIFLFLQKNADVLFSSFQKPKQKRHRCRNPNKLDINTLTGEERVPVVNKRNGKKVIVEKGN